MESFPDHHAALAALAWQIELGATEPICDAPIDRYALSDTAPAKASARTRTAALPPPEPVTADPVGEARALARAAGSLEALQAAMAGYDHCELKKGARNLVFSDGVPGAAVMLIGEAPGRDEDLAGKPFVGRAGQLLDRMLEAIGLSRRESVYITNVLPWRPPQNRDPQPDEIAMLTPFLQRHVALAAPKVLVLMGNISCQAVIGKRGITRLHGQWTEAWGVPALPMFHPAYLLRQPGQKKGAWADLLDLQAHLRTID